MKKVALYLTVISLSFTACKKDLEMVEPEPSPNQVTAMEDLKATPEFDWKTTKEIQIEVKANMKAVLYIKSASGTVYHKSMLTTGETFHSAITIPSLENELEIVLGGQSKLIPVTDPQVTVSFP